MSAPTQVTAQRTEAFFRHCNDRNAKSPYLRTKPRIIEALGLLGVPSLKARVIMERVVRIWQRDGPTNLRTREGQKRREDTTAEVSTIYPEVFAMPCNGPEEELFVREKAIHAMIWYATSRTRPQRRRGARRAAQQSQTQAQQSQTQAQQSQTQAQQSQTQAATNN
ncbi:hypothetical protein CLCR_10921 [Cladophialophora carrionii]|uniref:Uncharacterized protein n=1 Tax=Cladophialophora carrionii TaxID=86049 RepID=A0A1C1CXG0_9EURO|nr:hypothetical protein CLCR_10921 [Cladophialophora carrionii]